ncbi:uncharacterized protein DS421_4g128450 [Arachis hypogaea]|nr:uncharacterized protein DS421_4g128450 [Arachis hypogaea]
MEKRQPPPIPPTQGVSTPPIFSVADLPTVAMMDPRQYMAVSSPIGPTASGDVDLQTVACELINRHVPLQALPQTSGSNAASTSAPSLSSSK